jgi:hypothetical protein
MFELAASELLYPPGEPTLPVRIVSLFTDFKLGPGMALSMLNIGICRPGTGPFAHYSLASKPHYAAYCPKKDNVCIYRSNS